MSIGIILASHGEFALGVKQTGDMIFGEQEQVDVCVLMPENSPEEFRRQVEQVLAKYSVDDELLCLVDLWSGTPFNQLNQLKEEGSRKIEIVSGLNIPMLLQAYSERFNPKASLNEIVQTISTVGVQGIKTSLGSTAADLPSNTAETEPSVVASVSNKMSELGISHVRLDERLIHGQVATLWLGKMGTTRVMIVDDGVVNDPIAKASLKAAVPGGIKLSILKTVTAAKRLKEGIYQDQKIMLLTKKIQTIFDLIDAGVPIESFNLGNASSREGTLQIKKSVFLTEAEIAKILELEKAGVVVTAQMVPMEEEKRFSQFYGK
ncbi:PTS sugar transporter subunit IIB [Enterococcus hirae]|uniref:PTS mannose/fructose/sorbose transporter subunit IIAB n=1 Tax=Enterococcus hirae TaxID=1354 RepID=UPI001E09E660|nr:PTS sugar transporter subunit IIB [Enterococcus hirae]EMF0258613.1 PTS sugar transporter subunit IIB [Enterococcus hirae]MBS6191922.1 PTS sugar transporter subunit IIB [Enterococcus hirae]